MRVCILGAGLTCLALAKALVNQNIYVEIFSDKKKEIIDQSRTIGITKSNVEYFNNNIVNIKKILWKIKKIEIFSEKKNKEKLLKFENNNEQLFSIVKNYELKKILEKSLIKNKFYKQNYKKKFSYNYNSYDLVINLDFSNLITKKFFNKKIIKKYESYAFTGILKHEKINNRIARQIFTKIGPLAFLPISERETSIVYSIKNSKNFNNDNFIELIKHYNFIYNVKEIQQISSFELYSINLRSYYHKNILAFGELTHKIHPLAGQGFNMTVRDIKYLIEIIKTRKELGLPLNSSVNQEFQKNVRHRNFIFSSGIDIIYELFNFDGKLKNHLFINSLKYLSKKDSINKIFKKIADKGLIY